MPIFKKKLSRYKLGKYLHNSNFAYIIFTKDRLPLFWNDAAEKLLHEYLSKEPKIMFDKYLMQILSPDEYKRISIFLANYVKKCSFELEFEKQNSLAKSISLKFDVAEQQDGNFFVIIDDITQQKIKERFLITQKQDAEKAGKLRSLFLANVSHEIRTPIQTIIGTMELIHETNLDEEQLEYARQIAFSADILLALVNDVLDFSKLESGNMTLENTVFGLSDCVEQTVDLISIEAHKKGLEVLIDIDTAIPEFIIGDPTRLRQVLLNFVKNAVKFTEYGSLSVSVRQITEKQSNENSEHESPFLLFEVADTGIGIKADQKDKIFNSFYQENAAINRKYGGTGLGLAISKNIVTTMKGKIGLRDNIKEGSIFWFTIPLIADTKKTSQENILLRKDVRFLIVDDSMQTLSIIKKMLTTFGFKDITLVNSGEQAIAAMRQAVQHNKPFDIVFIDMIMPKMDGWRLGAEIHNDSSLRDSKLYLMIPEGRLGGDTKMKLLEWFEDYLYKPLKRRHIFKLLNDIYRKSEDAYGADDIHELEPIETADIAIPIKTDTAHALDKTNSLILEEGVKGAKILVVDDHPVNLNLLKIMLEKSGCIVSTAENGQQAIDIASTADFDIIFMDIQMPILNGYETTQILRHNGYKHPIIACTAGSQEDERKICLSMKMNDIIAKPFNKKQLLDMVKKHIPPHKKV